jgi:CheY-like chemotaxis protein
MRFQSQPRNASPKKSNPERQQLVLVVDDVEEVRDGIAALLLSDGYIVDDARSEECAIEIIQRRPPELILLNIAGLPEQVTRAARRISRNGGLADLVPIVMFCVEGLEGAETYLGGNLYTVRPVNFNQIRRLLQRLLDPLMN